MAKKLKEEKQKERVHVIKPVTEKSYEPDIGPKDNVDFWTCNSLDKMVGLLQEKKSKIEIEAKVLGVNKNGKVKYKKLNREAFLGQIKKKQVAMKPIREAFNDGFFDEPISGGLVGDDFIPLLGGPFNKQQYNRDYLAAHMQCFYAYHHDPFARRIISTIRDFTLGRDWRVDAKCLNENTQKMAQVLWSATEEANGLRDMMDTLGIELPLYGEVMTWELPDDNTKIIQKKSLGENIPKGVLPRFRLIDPSVIWDIITWPEDITNVLAYQWVAPTQYQTYQHVDATGVNATTLKFIYQQIPAAQVDHFKINCVSNEKRGRSDLYPIIGYLKRLRDSINYEIIAHQKASAYSIDTTVDGSQSDLDAYRDSQEALGAIPPAGSEFIHTKKIERKYIGVEGAGSKELMSFEWCLNAIAAGSGIPVNYFGVHMSGGGQSRASAMVSTEPVVKLFESRRNVYKRILEKLFQRTMKKFGLKDVSCEITFPEIVSQDRSTKLADLNLAMISGWLSKETCANIASKEFSISEFDYNEEQQKISDEGSAGLDPLTAPGKTQTSDDAFAKPKQTTQDDKRDLKQGRGQ